MENKNKCPFCRADEHPNGWEYFCGTTIKESGLVEMQSDQCTYLQKIRILETQNKIMRGALKYYTELSVSGGAAKQALDECDKLDK